MKKVLLRCNKKYIDALLNNSKLLNGKDLYKLSEIEIHNILFQNNIHIFDKKTNESQNYDFIIIDELEYYDESNHSSTYYFIPPIDFNISDPFISNKWPKSLYDSKHPNKVAWANTFFTNLYFLGSNIFESPNQILDLSLILNLNNHSENWGIYHYSARNLFRNILSKPYRLDYSFREVKKENRVKFFIELLENLSDSELKNIKLSAHGNFLIDEKYYIETKEFFNSQNCLHLFLELEKLDKKFFSFDELLNPKPGYSPWPVNKLFLNTFSSDISLYFETAREKEGTLNTMNYLITEKTIDLLNVEKPFIHMSNNVEIFLDKFGFINYNKEIFNKISVDKVELVKKISLMQITQYHKLINLCRELSNKNAEILDSYYKNNTFLFNLVHN